MKHAFTLGQFVRLIVPGNIDLELSNDRARGRIIMRETQEDFDGERLYVVVRWFGQNGEPDENALRHSPSELEALS